MSRLSTIKQKREISILEMVTNDVTFSAAVEGNDLTFSNGTIFMVGDEVADFLADYSLKKFLYSSDYKAEFIATINSYWGFVRSNYKRIDEALNAIYSVVNTYERHEKHLEGLQKGGQADTETNTGTEKETSTDSGSVEKVVAPTGTSKTVSTETGSSTEEQTLQRAPYDTSDLSTAEKVTKVHTPTELSTTTETSFTGRQDKETTTYNARKNELTREFNNRVKELSKSFENTLQDSISGENVRGNELRKAVTEITGRMGNTPVSELINDEVITRLKYSIKRLFMFDFISEYLI